MPNDQVMDKKNKLAKVPRDVLKSMSNMGAKKLYKGGLRCVYISGIHLFIYIYTYTYTYTYTYIYILYIYTYRYIYIDR